MNRIKVRIVRKHHYLNGRRKEVGTVVSMQKWSAEQLIARGLAERVRTK